MLLNALRTGAMMNQGQNPMEGQSPMGAGFSSAMNPAMAISAMLRKKDLGGSQVPQPATMQQPQPMPQQPPQMPQQGAQQAPQPQPMQPQGPQGGWKDFTQKLRTKGTTQNMLGGAAQGAMQGAAMGGVPGAIIGGTAGFLQNGGMEKIKPMLNSIFKIF